MNRRSVSSSNPSHPATIVKSDDEKRRPTNLDVDVEKQLLHRSFNKKRRNNNALKFLSIGMGILLVLIIAGSTFSFSRRHVSRQSEVDRFQQDTLELLSSVMGTVDRPDEPESSSTSPKWQTSVSQSSGRAEIAGKNHWSGTVKSSKTKALSKPVIPEVPEP